MVVVSDKYWRSAACIIRVFGLLVVLLDEEAVVDMNGRKYTKFTNIVTVSASYAFPAYAVMAPIAEWFVSQHVLLTFFHGRKLIGQAA